MPLKSNVCLIANAAVISFNRFSLGPVSLEVTKGSRIAVIGNNGGGKTTLLYLLGGLYHPTQGEVLQGHQRAEIAYITDQVAAPPHWTLDEVVRGTIALRGGNPRDANNALELKGKDWRKTTVAKASKGMRAQAQLVALRAMPPLLLFCDEPSSGLDPEVQDELREFLAGFSGTLFLTTHYFSELDFNFSTTLLLQRGQVTEIEKPSREAEWKRLFA